MNFNQAYHRYYKKVSSYISYKVNSPEIGEEIAQDVFMKVYNNFSSYDENKASMETWIFNIAANAIIDYWRKAKLDTTSISEVNEEGNEILQLSGEETPLSFYLKNEYAELLNAYLNRLPKIYKESAALYYQNNLSYNEIATELNIPLSTVKIRLLRAKDRLRKFVKPELFQ